MRIIRECTIDEVVAHWRDVEQWRVPISRTDILDPLPDDIRWYEAEIQTADIDNLFIISSDDWRTITDSFRVNDTVEILDSGLQDKKITIINRYRACFEKTLNSKYRRLIIVSPSFEGNFTILEGNKRAVALSSINQLRGTPVFLGVSSDIEHYGWARYANRARGD